MNKVYVDENNRALIICPKCGFEKNVGATNIRTKANIANIECKCGETFQTALEYRKYYRKEVRLSGDYIVQEKGERGEAIIRELSLSGIRFESMRPHKISVNDILEMKFNLDNPLRSEIRKLAKVIWVKDRIVGLNFSEKELQDQVLAFYLRDYAVGDRFYRDFIQNISAGGAFIETSQTFSKGQKILMIFMSPDHQLPFKINGEIVRIHSDGIGVTFKLKSQVQEMVLKSYIRKIQS
jgi:Tfp pilus assembly protein PilZ